MTFVEIKAKAKKDGMKITNRTKKTDIIDFYASMEEFEDFGEFKTITIVNDKCPFCGVKLYHKLCAKHGRMI